VALPRVGSIGGFHGVREAFHGYPQKSMDHEEIHGTPRWKNAHGVSTALLTTKFVGHRETVHLRNTMYQSNRNAYPGASLGFTIIEDFFP